MQKFRLQKGEHGWDIAESRTIRKSKDESLIGTVSWSTASYYGTLEQAATAMLEREVRERSADGQLATADVLAAIKEATAVVVAEVQRVAG